MQEGKISLEEKNKHVGRNKHVHILFFISNAVLERGVDIFQNFEGVA